MNLFAVPQIGYSAAETLVVLTHFNGECIPTKAEDIIKLPKDGWFPVGTVEFCEAVMRHQGIPEPEPMDYPESLHKWMIPHKKALFSDVPQGWSEKNNLGLHVKPVKTKFPVELWTPTTPVWIGQWKDFGPEYRVYVLRGEILGISRYDQFEDELEETHKLDEQRVNDMVKTFEANGAPIGYGLDVGVLRETKETVLVEVNDGWALGYYPWGLKQNKYLDLIQSRWEELLAARLIK